MRVVGRREFLLLGFPWIFFWRKRSAKIADAEFRIVRKGDDRRRYIWIHGNEQTARVVLAEHMQRREGRAFMIVNDRRNVRIGDGQLDPNRMFSDAGAEQNLRTLNPQWSEAQFSDAVLRLRREREKFVQTILPKNGGVLVALHNNSSGYSVKDEVPISDEVALNNESRPHEFMLCTMRDDYERLKKSQFNVVLQSRAPKTDDGSLSRLCALRGVRYINIEAALGNSADQISMLEFLESALPA